MEESAEPLIEDDCAKDMDDIKSNDQLLEDDCAKDMDDIKSNDQLLEDDCAKDMDDIKSNDQLLEAKNSVPNQHPVSPNEDNPDWRMTKEEIDTILTKEYKNLSEKERTEIHNYVFTSMKKAPNSTDPNAIVSVISCSGDFPTKGKNVWKLQNGFINAVKSGAWIFTYGAEYNVVNTIKLALNNQQESSQKKSNPKEKSKKDQISLFNFTTSYENTDLIEDYEEIYHENPNQPSQSQTIGIKTENLQEYRIDFELFMSERDVTIFEQLLEDALIEDKYDFAILYLDYIEDINLFVKKCLCRLFTKCMTNEDSVAGKLFKRHLHTTLKQNIDDELLKIITLKTIGRGIQWLVSGSPNPFKTESKGSALYASALLNGLSRIASDAAYNELLTDFDENSRSFEQQACEVMSHLYNTNEKAAHKLLMKKMIQYGNTRILSLAVRNDLRNFTAITACQTKVYIIWHGHIEVGTSSFKIIICCFLPFLVLTPIIELHSTDSKTHDEHSTTGKQSQNTTNKDNEDNICCKKLYNFLQAPVTKFTYHVVTYVAFLIVFSIFVLCDLYPVSEGGPTYMEIILWCWSGTMTMEEIRQIIETQQVSTKEKIKAWLSDVWNLFDVVIITLGLVSIVFRFLIPLNHFYYARLSYTATLALFYMRCMQFFLVSRFFGPKVVMIGRMIADTFFFMVLFALFVFSFGIMYHATLFPNAELSWDLFQDTIYLPFWQLYGELLIDNVKGKEPSDCTNDPALYKNGTFQRCPQPNTANTAILGLYLILTNILLLNVLIALFSNTFERIQANSALVWKFHFVSLVKEYEKRPVLNPPLNIICLLYRLLKKCISLNKSIKEDDEELEMLTLKEKDALYSYQNVWAKSHIYQKTKGKRDDNTKPDYDVSVSDHLLALRDGIMNLQECIQDARKTSNTKFNELNLRMNNTNKHVIFIRERMNQITTEKGKQAVEQK